MEIFDKNIFKNSRKNNITEEILILTHNANTNPQNKKPMHANYLQKNNFHIKISLHRYY